MPWTLANPPNPAKNVSSDRIKSACVKAANSALAGGKTEGEAIQACIGAMRQAAKGKLFFGVTEEQTDAEYCDLVQRAGELGLGFVTFEGEPPTEFNIEYEDGRMMALGTVGADVDFSKVRALYFHSAVLAREESNRNRDELPPEEIEPLAKSMGGMPIDDEHEFSSVVGVFTGGKRIEGANGKGVVATDGLIWAQRFPDIARETVEGKRKLSMEIWIASATCSMCGETFSSAVDYCPHLKHKEANRILHGVQGFGGALTVKPAGTDTIFDSGSMMVVASHRLDENPALETDKKTKEGAKEMEPKEIEKLQEDLATAVGRITELETNLATATQDLKESTEAAAELRWSIREQALLSAGYDGEKLKTDKGTLEPLPEEAFDILVAALVAGSQGKKEAEKKEAEKKDSQEKVGASVMLSRNKEETNEQIELVL